MTNLGEKTWWHGMDMKCVWVIGSSFGTLSGRPKRVNGLVALTPRLFSGERSRRHFRQTPKRIEPSGRFAETSLYLLCFFFERYLSRPAGHQADSFHLLEGLVLEY